MALTAESQSGSMSKSSIILAVVLGLHGLLFYALESGMARKMVELLPQDIQTKFIEEKKPDVPPPPPPPPPPDVQIPPPFIPPPEVAVTAPPMASPIQTVITERPPVAAPPVMAPPAPRAEVVVNPKIDPKRPPRGLEEFYPPNAKRQGQEGSVIVALFVQADGKVTEAKVDTSSGFEELDEGAIKYAKTWRLLPGSRNGIAESMWYKVKLTFKINK